MSTVRPLPESVTVSPTEGRPNPDAATRETIGFAPRQAVLDLEEAIAAIRGTKKSEYGQEFVVAGLKAVAAPKVISM